MNEESAASAAGQLNMFKTISWGVREEIFESPNTENIVSFTEINPQYYALADTHTITFWSTSSITGRIDLRVRCIAYISRIKHIVCYTYGSSQLSFVGTKYPFPIRTHPLHFSNKIIVKMHYFEQSSILVCSGHGIMISRVVVPDFFNFNEPVVETLQFDKVCELYNEIKFTNPAIPLFIKSTEQIVVPVRNSVYIHSSEGKLIKTLSNITVSEITSVSFFDETEVLIIGDLSGCVTIMSIDNKNDSVIIEVGKNMIISANLFDRNFLVVSDLSSRINVFNVRKKKIVQEERCTFVPITYHVCGSNLFLISMYKISCFKCAVFTKHYSALESDNVELIRCPSSSRAARILCLSADHRFIMFRPQDGTRLFDFTPISLSNAIQKVKYSRDIVFEGPVWKNVAGFDACFFLLDNGNLMTFHFDKVDKQRKPSSVFSSEDPKFKAGWIYDTIISNTKFYRIADMVRIETKKHPNTIAVILNNGQTHLLSTKKKIETHIINSGINNVLTAAFSIEHELLIYSSINRIIAFSVDTEEIVSSSEKTNYTFLLVISKDRIVCGSADGTIDIRSLPKLEVIASSGGSRDVISEHPLESHYAIKKIDYCENRKAILSVSNSGELNLWNKNAKKIAVFDFPFEIINACFQDGNGSIIVSMFSTLFTIDCTLIFGKPFFPLPTPLDDYDLRKDDINDIKPIQQMQIAAKKNEIEEEEEEHESLIKPRTDRRKSSSVWTSATGEEEEKGEKIDFDQLIVEEEIIPKRHIAPPREDEEEHKDFYIHMKDLEELMNKEEKPKKKAKKQENIEPKKEVNAIDDFIDRALKSNKRSRTFSTKQPKEPKEPKNSTVSSHRTFKRKKIKRKPITNDEYEKFNTKKNKPLKEESEDLIRNKAPPRRFNQPKDIQRMIQDHYNKMVTDDSLNMKLKQSFYKLKTKNPFEEDVEGRRRIIPHVPAEFESEIDFPIQKVEDENIEKENNTSMQIEKKKTKNKKVFVHEPSVSRNVVVSNDSKMFTQFRIDGFEQPFGGFSLDKQRPHTYIQKTSQFGTWNYTKGAVEAQIEEDQVPLLRICTANNERKLIPPEEPIQVAIFKKPQTAAQLRITKQSRNRNRPDSYQIKSRK